MKKIAILGATGYIGKSLLREFFDDKEKCQLFLFSRSKDKIKDLLKNKPKEYAIRACSYNEFSSLDCDVVINCTGIKSLSSLKQNPTEVFRVTEEIDDMVIGYLRRKPKTLYINLSSGGVYGHYGNYKKPIDSKTKAILNVNNISPAEYYSIAKINSEAKHRSMPDFNIVDLRVFAFFGRFVGTNPGFLMPEIIDCIRNKKIFKTNEINIIRDYITPKDLFSLIMKVIKKQKINDFFDVYSKKPVSKLELLAFLEKKYGLKYSIKKAKGKDSVSTKKIYYSKNKKAAAIGYIPEYTSLKGIQFEVDKMGL